uniref:Bactericidal permeability-increasing protein-like isoform X2 n=1 Tax=Phascolarctos cinereus TaxID=38626 RepID=A0A6P5KNB0_PHACI|nr:bactericidal permeability-increasing protein-like isoform X2 [Phascolarctos cinereus]
MEVKYSAFGRFDVSPIQQTLNFLASLFLFPAANAKLQAGFSLPLTRDISFYDFILQPYKNYLLLGANIHYGLESEN